MSEDEDSYCRLCAEPTPDTQLISADGDVGLNSKITTKMQWINVDINLHLLPTTICFSCFDSLERTWTFLHNVRAAQAKLKGVFMKENEINTTSEVKPENSGSVENTGQPVNIDWEEFKDPKPEVKDESPIENLQVITVDPNTLTDVDFSLVKTEHDSDIEFDNDAFNSTDSDLPLGLAVKKKKLKKKKHSSSKITETSDSLNASLLTWDEYMCRCASCDAQCKNIASLRLHSIQIHSCCCAFKCSDCNKVISNFRAFVSHVRIHNEELKYCCEFCNKRFTRSSYVKKHCNLVHRDTFLTTCGNCGSIFDTEEQLDEHYSVYVKGMKKRLADGNSKTDLKCEHCNREFKSLSNLNQHKLVHTNRSRDFACHVCGKMFFIKGTLTAHMATHDDTRPFKCEFCPLSFRARGNLQSHISLHSGSKPFVCEQCGKSFRVKRHLKSHSIVHTDLMPYPCQYCNKLFRFKTRLNLHLRQHTGAKPYTCMYCARAFTNGSNYKKHMKRRHNIDITKKKAYNVVEDSKEHLNDVASQS